MTKDLKSDPQTEFIAAEIWQRVLSAAPEGITEADKTSLTPAGKALRTAASKVALACFQSSGDRRYIEASHRFKRMGKIPASFNQKNGGMQCK